VTSERHSHTVERDSRITSGVPIPDLDPRWPDDATVAVVTSGASPPGWRRLAHQVAAIVQPGGHSFPLAEPAQDSRPDDLARRAFLYRQANRVCGYLVLANKTVTGYREASARYRETDAAERVTRTCVMVVWVAPEMRRRGVARQLVDEAARNCGIRASGLAWAEPFTDSGYLLARFMAPDGMWIADYS
jgi:ribosomal protein S18 acetylase RimI-like enzyme